jgi:hypothetical protein
MSNKESLEERRAKFDEANDRLAEMQWATYDMKTALFYYAGVGAQLAYEEQLAAQQRSDTRVDTEVAREVISHVTSELAAAEQQQLSQVEAARSAVDQAQAVNPNPAAGPNGGGHDYAPLA